MTWARGEERLKGDFYLFIVSLRESELGVPGGERGPEVSPTTFSMLHYLQCDDVNVDGCCSESTVEKKKWKN